MKETTNKKVTCCFGLCKLAKNALDASGKNIPFRQVVVGIRGELFNLILILIWGIKNDWRFT